MEYVIKNTEQFLERSKNKFKNIQVSWSFYGSEKPDTEKSRERGDKGAKLVLQGVGGVKIDEAIGVILQDLETVLSTSVNKYIILELKPVKQAQFNSQSGTHNWLTLPIYNPYSDTRKLQNNMLGQNNNNMLGSIMGQMEQMRQTNFTSQMEMQRMLHQQQIESMKNHYENLDRERELREQIAYEQHKNNDGLIQKWLDHPVIASLVKNVAPKVIAKLAGVGDVQQKIEQESHEVTDQFNDEDESNIRAEQSEIGEVQASLESSMQTFNEVFGDDTIVSLEKLAVFCKRNPDMAKDLLRGLE